MVLRLSFIALTIIAPNGAMKFHVGTNFKSGLAVEISSTLSDLVDLLLSWQLKFLGKLKIGKFAI
jgi:hypothetical protein